MREGFEDPFKAMQDFRGPKIAASLTISIREHKRLSDAFQLAS